MSQDKAPYDSGSPLTLDSFKNKPCALPYSDENYQPPTPDEITALINLCGWSQKQTAEMVGAKFNEEKGSTTIRKWRTQVGKAEHRQIPYAAWRLMLLYAGVVEFSRQQENEWKKIAESKLLN